MTIYAYLDAAGYVRQWSTGPSPSPVEGMTLHQLLPGETMREYLRLVDGALVEYEPEILIEDARAGAIADANARRARQQAAFYQFEFDGVLYDGDARAEASIGLAARRAEQANATAVLWRARDNQDHLLMPAQVVALEAALIAAKSAHATALHQACCVFKRAIMQAQTVVEIRALEAAE